MLRVLRSLSTVFLGMRSRCAAASRRSSLEQAPSISRRLDYPQKCDRVDLTRPGHF
ncbi:MAG: hypothetical protein M3O33_23345 [Cyanobacteriota bacterium]|nr:hypothetical protein [Cyanobacteriota bacterium]